MSVQTSTGAFARALIDPDQIRTFISSRVNPLRAEEADLEAAWRPGFRVKLPYYRLLDSRQQGHVRGIFARMLPDPDVALESFDRDERILLDVLAETYISQASVFADLMDEHRYVVVEHASRDVPRRIIALSLSASIFFLDVPDHHKKRRYRYSNIYGNQEIRPEGRCRLKGSLRIAKPIRSLEFRSSPLLMLAIQDDGDDQRMGFQAESQILRHSFVTRMRKLTFKASNTFSDYTGVRPIPGEPPDQPEEGDPSDDPDGNGER